MTTQQFAPGWLADQLPRALSDDPFTRRFLRIFEDVAESVRRNVIAFEHDLDVAFGPMEFVRWMGSWLALTAPATLPEPRQRDLVAAAGAMWRRRGTKPAVVRLLEAVTASAVEIDDGGGVFEEGGAPPNRKAVVVRLESRGGLTDEQLLELLRLEVPANATVELVVPPAETTDRLDDPPAKTTPEASAPAEPPEVEQ